MGKQVGLRTYQHPGILSLDLIPDIPRKEVQIYSLSVRRMNFISMSLKRKHKEVQLSNDSTFISGLTVQDSPTVIRNSSLKLNYHSEVTVLKLIQFIQDAELFMGQNLGRRVYHYWSFWMSGGKPTPCYSILFYSSL